MYREFFGLRKAPFNLTPDPEFLYLTAQHREALAGLTYAILARKGFVALTGDAGTGKTTLLTRILGHLPVTRIRTSLIVNPTLTPPEFLESTLLDFGFAEVPPSKPQRIAELQKFLWMGSREGLISTLIIDEAHKLSMEVLEEIRLLGNFESAGEKLLQIVLVGQCELDDLLSRGELRQLKQRIALRLTIEPLQGEDLVRYIGHRWMKAGGDQAPFTGDALARIAEVSEGIPRVINVICDNALMEAFGEKSGRVEARHVLGVCRDLRLSKTDQQSTPEPSADRQSANIETAHAAEDSFAPAVWEFPMKTLDRYSVAAHRSPLARLANKLGLTRRIETA